MKSHCNIHISQQIYANYFYANYCIKPLKISYIQSIKSFDIENKLKNTLVHKRSVIHVTHNRARYFGNASLKGN